MPKAIVIGSGEVDSHTSVVSLINSQDKVICADGGANVARRLGIMPDLVVGDMDSIDPSVLDDLVGAGVIVLRHPCEKDESDLELALTEALRFKPDEILCLCVAGGRSDHFLTNMNVLARHAREETRISIMGNGWTGRFVTPAAPGRFTGKVGDTLSLVPFAETIEGATVDGVRWRLRDAVLFPGSSRTLSNKFESEEVSISIRSGILLAFHYF